MTWVHCILMPLVKLISDFLFKLYASSAIVHNISVDNIYWSISTEVSDSRDCQIFLWQVMDVQPSKICSRSSSLTWQSGHIGDSVRFNLYKYVLVIIWPILALDANIFTCHVMLLYSCCKLFGFFKIFCKAFPFSDVNRMVVQCFEKYAFIDAIALFRDILPFKFKL